MLATSILVFLGSALTFQIFFFDWTFAWYLPEKKEQSQSLSSTSHIGIERDLIVRLAMLHDLGMKEAPLNHRLVA